MSKLYIAKHDKDKGIRSCKVLGDVIPKGWKVVQEFFVDSSGFGSPGESALTFEQLLEKIRKGFGYAISDMGQFQLYIVEYERI